MPITPKSRTIFQTAGAVALSTVIALAAAPALASGGSGGGGGGGGTGSDIQRQIQRQAVDPVASYRAGLKAYDEGNYKKSVREFRKVLTVDRHSPEANYFVGMSYIGLDKPKRAVKYFRTAVKSHPAFVEAHEQYALTLVRLEKMDKAKERLTIMEEMAQDSSDAKLTASIERVRLAVETGEVPDQLSLALAPTGDSDLAGLLYTDAVRLINTQNYAAAITELYNAQYEAGLHADIQNYLGYTHRKLGRYDEAKTYYTRALALNPSHLGAREYLGELYIEIGDMKNARKQLAKLDKLCGFGCAEREELARLVNARRVNFAAKAE